MTITRRSVLKGITLGTGGACFAPGLLPSNLFAEAGGSADRPPRRIVFFLQNHGFDPRHATPEDIDISSTLDINSIEHKPEGTNVWRNAGTTIDRVVDTDLRSHKLPKFIEPLEPYKDRLTIIQGLDGHHVGPFHGAPFGALGGYRKGKIPRAETIDCAIARALPAVVPVLALALNGYESKIISGSSAWEQGKPVPMMQSPRDVYDGIFSVAEKGEGRDAFELETELYEYLQDDARNLAGRLPPSELAKFGSFTEGLQDVAARRRRLSAMSVSLARFAPNREELATAGRDTNSWEAHVKNAIAVLKSGVTNVVTMAAGACEAGGSWTDLGIETRGHALGHTNQLGNPEWLTLRRFNAELLVQIIKALEAEPEGRGTMMDNTLLVYTSCHGETHHSRGNRWPYLLIGSFGGRIRTGRHIHYPVTPPDRQQPYRNVRTINALFATLLHAAGAPLDYFNHLPHMQEIEPAGPLPELLA